MNARVQSVLKKYSEPFADTYFYSANGSNVRINRATTASTLSHPAQTIEVTTNAV